jgi:hypothetical protein
VTAHQRLRVGALAIAEHATLSARRAEGTSDRWCGSPLFATREITIPGRIGEATVKEQHQTAAMVRLAFSNASSP